MLHHTLSAEARNLMQKKNADYAHGDDPFRNFRAAEVRGVHPAKGILIRIDDKLQRFASFIERGDLKVSNESLRDSAIDVINYVVLMYGLLTEKNSNDSNDLKDIVGVHRYHMNLVTREEIETGKVKMEDVISQGAFNIPLTYDPTNVHGQQLAEYEERKNPNGTTWKKEPDCSCKFCTRENNNG